MVKVREQVGNILVAASYIVAPAQYWGMGQQGASSRGAGVSVQTMKAKRKGVYK